MANPNEFVPMRCSCGTFRICAPGDLHDCATERAVADQKCFHSAVIRLLDRIACALEQPRAAPPEKPEGT